MRADCTKATASWPAPAPVARQQLAARTEATATSARASIDGPLFGPQAPHAVRKLARTVRLGRFVGDQKLYTRGASERGEDEARFHNFVVMNRALVRHGRVNAKWAGFREVLPNSGKWPFQMPVY